MTASSDRDFRSGPFLQRDVREAERRGELQDPGGLLRRLQGVLRHVLLLPLLLHLHHPRQQQQGVEGRRAQRVRRPVCCFISHTKFCCR